MAEEQLVSLTIDGVPLQVPKGTLLVEAAKQIKQEIPVYCYHTKLGPAGLCRVCLVEIEGMPKLQIACNTPVAEGMVVHTQNEKVDTGRGMILELLLVNHPLDCPICDKGGECDLQDYAMAYGRGSSDVADPKQSKPKGVDLGPTIVLDEERCVVCQRCVRFDEIIAAENQLVVKDRGHNDIIATATGDPYRHNFTGNVTELCPVGALTSKTYRFKSRPWDLNRTQSSCTQCAVGCQQFVDVRYGNVLRTMSVENDDAISDGWLCDRGRYNVGFYTSPERITQPLYKHNGTFVQITWDDAFVLWGKAIRDAQSAGRGAGAIGGGRLLNEEAYLLQHVFRGIGVQNLDWRAGRQVTATPARSGSSYDQIENAAAILVIGESPEELAPVMWLRAIKAVTRRGAKLIRIASLDRKPNFEHTDVANVDAALQLIPQDGQIVVFWDGIDAGLGAQLRSAMESRGGIAFIASEQPNARGAEAMGMLPQEGGMDSAAMLDAARRGEIGALSLFGVNPVRNGLDPAGVREALKSTPFVVVSELFMTETAELATLVLPARAAFEKSGTTLNIAGQLLPVNESLKAPEGTLSDLEMLVGLAQQFDLALPTVEELEQAVLTRTAQSSPVTLSLSKGPDTNVEARPARSIWDGGGTVAHDQRIAALRADRIVPTDTELVEA
jgi:NADH-quinone oxidoreductase subunit G